MAKLEIANPGLSNEEDTYLESDYSTGTDLTVRNNEGFNAEWFTVVGEHGQEQTEIKDIGSLTDNDTIVLSGALKFSHPKTSPVVQSRFDRLYVEWAPDSGGSFSVITNAETSNGYWDIEWDNNRKSTFVVDDSHSSGVYRWRFRNSVTGTYSAYSGELPAAGIGRNQAGYTISKITKNTIAKGIPIDLMFEYMTDFQDLVYEEMPEAWWFTKQGDEVSTASGDYDYSISDNWSDLLSIKYVLFRYISGSVDNTYPLKYITPLQFYNKKADANQSESDSIVQWSFLPPDSDSAKGYIGLHPTPDTAACYIKPVYYYEISRISSFSDTLVIPSSKGYEDYVLFRIFDDVLNDDTAADRFNVRVARSLNALKKRSRRQMGDKKFRRFLGQKGHDRLYGNLSGMSTDDIRENYW